MIAKVAVLMVVAMAGATLAAPADPYKEPGMPFNFAYGVRDDYAGTDFGHQEESDGNVVRGSYTVQLPDGRKQTVNYQADHDTGYVAQVEYYGEAQYPHEYGPAVTFQPQQGYQQQQQQQLTGYQK